MILNKIKLNDFVSHKRTELDLGYGINVVVGPNGAGKTSVLDAIAFALFNDHSGRGKRENLINSKAKKCGTSVQFVDGGITYSAEWSMERGKSAKGTLYRMHNGAKTLLAQDGSTVLTEIEKILAMDKSMFFQSIYVQQGEIEELVTAKPAERKKIISRLLGVEDLEKAWNGIKDIINTYDRKQTALEAELKQRSVIEDERRRHVTAAAESITSIASQKEELRKAEEEINALQTSLEQLKKDKREFDRLDKEKAILEEAVANDKKKLKTDRVELEKAVAAEKLVKALEGEISKLPFLEQYSQCILERKEQEAKQRTLEEKLGNLTRLEEAIKENEEGFTLYVQKNTLHEEKIKERKQYEGSDKVYEKAMKTISELEKQERKDNAALEKELKKSSEILGIPVTLETIELLLSGKKTELSNVKTELDEGFDQRQKNVGMLEHREKELEDNLAKLEPSETGATKCPTCETDLTAEQLTQLVSQFSSEKERIGGELEVAKSELTAIAKRRQQVEGQQKKVDKIEPERIKDKASQLDETQEKIRKQALDAEALCKNVSALQNIDSDLAELEIQLEELKEPYMQYESAKRELAKAQPREQILSEMKPVIAALETISQSTEECLANLGYEPEKPSEELEALRQKKEDYDRNIPIAKREPEFQVKIVATTQELASKEQKLSETITSITKLGYDEKRHSEKQNMLDTTRDSRNDLKEDIARLTQAKKNADDEVADCDKKLSDLKRKEQDKKEVDRFIVLLTKIRTAYGKDGVQKMIRVRARPLLETSTRDLFERFNLAYSDIRIDDDYGIAVIGPSGEQQIEQISGGERVALAIALRLGITQVLSGRVETIVMDEPTTHLDEERRKELVNILSSFFREGGRIIPQMLIITHHPEIVDVADVVYTIRKEDGYSIAESGSITTGSG